MRNVLAFGSIGLFWGLLLTAATVPANNPPAKPIPGWATTCELDRVIDGDTIDVRVSRVIRVRLLDCWAPEKRDPGGPESTENITRLLGDGELTLLIPVNSGEVQRIWSFGRALGWVWSTADADKSVNELQVIQGHATAEKIR